MAVSRAAGIRADGLVSHRPETKPWRACICAVAWRRLRAMPANAAINEAFAEANAVKPGTDVRVLLNGRAAELSYHRHRPVAGIRLRGEAGAADSR